MNIKKQLIHGFTIVELLIVIAIIGILTTIVAVSYTGVQNNAIGVSLQSDLSNASDFLRIDQARNSTGSFPDTLALANGGKGIPFSSGTSYPTYVRNNSTLPHTFCLTATKSGQNYFITQEGTPMPGVCPVLYLDAGIATSYSGTGTAWNDLSGSGKNGVLTGGVTYSSSNDGILNFDGVNDFIELGDVLDMGTNSMTISAFIKLAQNNASNYIVSKSLAAGQNYRYGFRVTNGNLAAFIQGNGGADIIPVGTTALALNTWYMATCVFDRASGIKLYVNSNLENLTGSATISQWNGLDFESSNPFRIGAYTAADNITASSLFNGYVSRVQVYNKALNADDISKNFNALRSRYGL